jgi:hypothetical protein
MTETMRTVAILAVAALVLLWTAAAGAQQSNCLPRDRAIAHLAGQFDERVASQGLVEGGKAIIEVLVSQAGTWTVLVTDTGGISCVVASGESWTAVPILAGNPA